MIDNLLLLSGNDLPFPEAQINIHQPTLKEIAYIGEQSFFIGSGFLNFSKKLLGDEDKDRLTNMNDFDIFMSIMISKQPSVRDSVNSAYLVLQLIFPLYEISVRDGLIVLKKDGEEHTINRGNFSAFKNIVTEMFNLNFGQSEEDNYNPSGSMAQRIAEKFKQRHEKLAKMAREELGDGSQISVLQRYVSILAVGLQKDLNTLMNYTVYQLFDEFQRYQMKLQWDAYIQARMAGAKDLEEVENWMIDLRKQGKKKKKNKK
jgi:hypothetical protein